MTHHLIARLKNHEDALIERKPENVNDRELRKELVAFANSVPLGQEAVLFIGVSDSGEFLGVSNPDAVQERVRKCAEQDCYPPVPYQAHTFEVNGKNLVAVVVSASTEKPHFSGAAYVRVGSECKTASKEQYETLINSRNNKCHEIMRNKGAVFTVKVLNKVLGEVGHDVRPRTSMHECRIEDCNQHFIKLSDISTSRRYSEPLVNVQVSYDEERHRPMLVVSPKWA